MADIAHPGSTAPGGTEWQFVAGLQWQGRFALAYTVPGASTYTYQHRLYYHPYDNQSPPQPGTAVLVETLPDYEWYSGMSACRLADGTLFLLTARTHDDISGAPPAIVDRHAYLEYRLSRDDGVTWSAATAILSDYYRMTGARVWRRPNGGLLLYSFRELNDVAPHVYDYYLAGNVDSAGAWTFDDSGEVGDPVGYGEHPWGTGEQFFDNKLYSIQSTGATQGVSGYRSGPGPVFSGIPNIYARYADNHGNLRPWLGTEGLHLAPGLFAQAGRLYQAVVLHRWLVGGAQYEYDSSTSSVGIDTGPESSDATRIAKLHVDPTGIVWMWHLTTGNGIRLVSCREFLAGRLTNAFA